MDDLRQKVKDLKDSWKKVFTAMQASPQAWQPHMPYSSPAEIDEVVTTIVYLLDRSRAPNGFAPTFRIARGFAGTALSNTLTSVKTLEAGQYQGLPTFLIYLNQILSGFLTLIRFSDNDESRKAIEELAGKLSESLGLLDTAQRELSNKIKLLGEAESAASSLEEKTEEITKSIEENAETVAKSLEEKAGEITGSLEEKAEVVELHASNSKKALDNIQKFEATAAKSTETIRSNETEIEEMQKRLDSELERNEKLANDLESSNNNLSTLQKESRELNELIRALLPDAASAGLAAAFAKRVKQLDWTKWIWMGTFLVSILGLVVMAFFILYQNQQANQELWKVVLQRLPFTAPLIWLGWFSAVQYGNTVRVQEDYAFKEATAKAFVGYKDHMDHLANVNISDTKSAMLMLATKTIEILSHEPLRIYQKSSEDVSPTKALFDSMKGSSKDKSAAQGE